MLMQIDGSTPGRLKAEDPTDYSCLTLSDFSWELWENRLSGL
jgi:hypothetical protein